VRVHKSVKVNVGSGGKAEIIAALNALKLPENAVLTTVDVDSETTWTDQFTLDVTMYCTMTFEWSDEE